jgi:membrane protease YdiL (CAAX protease family)
MRKLNTLLLISLPIISNITSFIIFAPLYSRGREVGANEFKQAGNIVIYALLCIEILAFILILISFKKENDSLKQLINFDKFKIKLYAKYFLICLVPTLFAGWLYCKAQIGMGVETDISKYTVNEMFMWLMLTPLLISFMEEFIWRGYCLPKFSGPVKGIILTSISFAFFHGIFNPLVLLSTFLMGIIWGFLYLKTKSILPGFLLHLISRYLLFLPGFVFLIK